MKFYVKTFDESFQWVAKNRHHSIVDMPIMEGKFMYADLLDAIESKHWETAEMKAETGSEDFSMAIGFGREYGELQTNKNYVLICDGPRELGPAHHDQLMRMSQALRELIDKSLETTQSDEKKDLLNSLLESYEKHGCDFLSYQLGDTVQYDDGTTKDVTQDKKREQIESADMSMYDSFADLFKNPMGTPPKEKNSVILKDTNNDTTVKEFQQMLLDRGFKIGGSVEYINDGGDGEERLQDTFFYHKSAIVKTTEYINPTDYWAEHKTKLSWRSPDLYFNYEGPRSDLPIRSSNGKKQGNDAWYCWVDVSENVFSRMDTLLTSKYLSEKSVPEYKEGVGTYLLKNLVTNRQEEYSGIMQERMGGSKRIFSDSDKVVDRAAFHYFGIGQLMGFQENFKHFTPEFQEALSIVYSVLDANMQNEKIDAQKASPADFYDKAMKLLDELAEEDKATMTWKDVNEIEQEIRDYTPPTTDKQYGSIDALIARATAISEQSKGLIEDLGKLKDTLDKE